MYLERHISSKVLAISQLYSVVLITGPRQVGKSELARRLFPNHKWVLLDSLSLVEQAKNDPALFIKNNPPPAIYDEVQRAPELFLEIKDQVDRGVAGKADFVLTGSEPLPLMKRASESLAGRVGIVELAPMTISETHSRPKIDLLKLFDSPPLGIKFPINNTPLQILLRGGFPAMAIKEHSPSLEDVTQRFSDYVQTYLTKDLRELSGVKDLGRFERFLRLAATYSGKLLNVNEFSSTTGIPGTTLHDWLGILEASELLYQVRPSQTNLVKRETKRTKLLLCDSGLTLFLMGFFSEKQIESSPLLGTVFETFVANSLRALINCERSRIEILHWRQADTNEVDFILELDMETHIPIELKLTGKPSKEHIVGMKELMSYDKKAKNGILITTYEECFWIDQHILHLPWGAL